MSIEQHQYLHSSPAPLGKRFHQSVASMAFLEHVLGVCDRFCGRPDIREHSRVDGVPVQQDFDFIAADDRGRSGCLNGGGKGGIAC